MSGEKSALSVVVAGGGTAGHIEPALAVADAVRELVPDARITALGTAPTAGEQDLTLSWINVSNGRSGTQPLTNEARINPDGPATLTAIADTGAGQVVAVVSGGITTQKEGADPRSCTFLPTLGLVSVP